MRLLSPLVENGVCLRMLSGMNWRIPRIVPGLGQPSMASTVTRFSQRSLVTQIIGYSFLLPVVGATTICTVSGPTAAIGLRPSIWSVRATRAAWASIQAASAGTAATGTTADPSVPSQNKIPLRLSPLFQDDGAGDGTQFGCGVGVQVAV